MGPRRIKGKQETCSSQNLYIILCALCSDSSPLSQVFSAKQPPLIYPLWPQNPGPLSATVPALYHPPCYASYWFAASTLYVFPLIPIGSHRISPPPPLHSRLRFLKTGAIHFHSEFKDGNERCRDVRPPQITQPPNLAPALWPPH
jgi:hypothetical protein